MAEEFVQENTSKVMSFLVGAAVGAAVALLLAPKAGKEIRQDLKDFAGDARNKVSSTLDKGKELYEQNKSAVTGAIEAGKSAYTQEKEKSRQAA